MVNEFMLVFADDPHKHFGDKDDVKFTLCGRSLEKNDWEVSPPMNGGVCWRCTAQFMLLNELDILRDVVAAAAAWDDNPNPTTSKELHHRVDLYWKWEAAGEL